MRVDPRIVGTAGTNDALKADDRTIADCVAVTSLPARRAGLSTLCTELILCFANP